MSSASSNSPPDAREETLAGLLEALLALEGLGRLPRTGWLIGGVAQPESIAAHTSGVGFLTLALGTRVVPPLDVPRAALLALVHDAPEALLTDLPRAATELLGGDAKRAAERAAGRRLLAPFGELALALLAEGQAGASREARFVRLCDRLHIGVQLVHLTRTGYRGLDDFVAGLRALECGEFEPCEALRLAILDALVRGQA